MNTDVSIDDLVDRFTDELRNGDQPAIDDFVREHPQHEEQIRKLFPMLQLMESNRSDSENEISSASMDAEINTLPPLPPRKSIGDYRIVRELGRGGMGVVYLAEQESLGRSVAIKVLPESAQFDQRRVKRFELEAKAAGKLHHKNIVPVFDVGHEDNISFLVMQYIEGVSLDHVLRKMRSDSDADFTMAGEEIETAVNSGEAETDLELKTIQDEQLEAAESLSYSVAASAEAISGNGKFYRNVAKIGTQVGGALSYAHGNDVLHRDIKPGNLMVDSSGHAWIADFGLAKILDDINLTKTGETVGTLRYVSPEQLRGDADARSDIYSLGLTLYELLTLRPAFRGSDFAEIVESIGSKEPTRPRRLDPAIPRDLETIVLTAIEKDPQRRYQTASALQDDLQRFLDGRTIRARQASEFEKIVKAIKRRPAISALVLLLFVSLIAGTALTTWKWREATKALAIAQQEAKSREGINEFFIKDLLGQAIPNNQPDPEIKLRTVLHRGAQNVHQRFKDDPKTEADVRFQIGRVLYELTEYDDALKHYREAYKIRKSLFGEIHCETMQVLFRVGKAEKQLGNHEVAIECLDRVIDYYHNDQSPESANLLDAMIIKSSLLCHLGQYAEAEKVAREFIGFARDDADLDLKNGMERLAQSLYFQKKYVACEAVLASRMELSSKSSRMMSARNLLALSQLARGEIDTARETFGELFRIHEKEYGKKHGWTMIAAKNYADSLQKSGQFEQALEILDEYLPISQRVRGVTHRRTISIENLYAKVQSKMGIGDAELKALKSVRERLVDLKGEADRESISATIKLAWKHRKIGDFNKAAELFEAAYLVASERYGKDDRLALCALADLGDANRKQREYKLSEEHLTTTIERFRDTVDPTDPDLLLSIRSLAKLYIAIDRLGAAETLAKELVAGYQTLQGVGSADSIAAVEFLANVYFEQDDWKAARRTLEPLHTAAMKSDAFSEKARRYMFDLDYADGQLKDQRSRIKRILSYCELAESSNRIDGIYWKARGLLGQAYLANDELKTAEKVLLEAHAGLEGMQGEVEFDFFEKYMGRTAGRLTDLYDELNDEVQKKRWKKIYRSFRD